MKQGKDNPMYKDAMFYILKIYKEYSDEDNYLSYTDIQKLLEDKYHIHLTRNTIGKNVLALSKVFDIRFKKSGYRSALIKRELSNLDVNMIIDAILKDDLIGHDDTKRLIKYLNDQLSSYSRINYRCITKNKKESSNITRKDDKAAILYVNIHTVVEAINNHKQIEIFFKENSWNRSIVINPIEIYIKDVTFYIISNDNYSYSFNNIKDISII